MSTSARKTRKRARIQFQHPVKIGTPVESRAKTMRDITVKNALRAIASLRNGGAA